MRTFLANIIPNLQQFSQQLDDLSLLTNQHWVLIDEIHQSKTVYIFRKNGELLVSRNGKVEKARWEHLGNKSILIDIQAESFLFKHSFCDENIVALKLDSKNEYALFVNENRHSEDINTAAQVVTFLQNKYLDTSIEKQVKSTLGIAEAKEAIAVGSIENQGKKDNGLENQEKKDIILFKLMSGIIRIIFFICIGGVMVLILLSILAIFESLYGK